ncbi:MAG: hypothetical protein A3J10_04140 [Candidatus Sungbacteria bacterium RIFCSPLOWO2_02_FULL_54_10]|nr:MAG: hypothetical protein A3J10_04140 [Candidatus Sungbacteria bacterium RIFCSPLOWO2_02_FULL_54_10]
MTMKYLSFFFLFGLLAWGTAGAQALPAPVSLIASPPAPSPGEKITVTAATPSFDRHTAYFSWTIDGRHRPDLSGAGKGTIELTAGNIGSSQRVAVSVSRKSAAAGLAGGEAALTIRVVDLTLTYVAETLVPVWYRGKALPVPDAVVGVVAIPEFVIDGRRIPPERLIYRWGLDDEQNALSGIGEQVFRVRTSDLPGTSHEVKVRVEDEDGKVRREGIFYIVPYAPVLTIYSSSPLGGVEFRTAQRFTGGRGLFDFLAEPFFFPVAARRDLVWQWQIDGQPFAGNTGAPHLITIDTGGYPQGPLSVTASAHIPNSFLSRASAILAFFLQ